MVYFIRNLNLILPHCFILNLLQSFVSGSKTVSVLNGKVNPGASYASYKKWIAMQGAQELIPPENDVVTYFDNVGKYITKSYRVSSQKTARADIVTATLHFDLKENLQSVATLKTW